MTAAEYWDKYRPHRGEGRQRRPTAESFDWTGVTGNGPGAEILGDPNSALDMGPAEGENAAYLARAGVDVVAVDFSPVQVARAREFWSDVPNLEFVQAEACVFLEEDHRLFDAVYSTWGAVWFTDPEELFPRVAERLTPGGTFAFSHREPINGQYGAQKLGGKWLEGRETELTVYRWQYTAAQWTNLLKRHGFTGIQAEVLPHPEAGTLGTLLVEAHMI
ncbi:class I SAM-dependent methyltransferase [Streptomyces sp. TRM49041]|uniref:class I SAM-dependent methyltransferase n=1 Tax=Streptomyces sp. TRM49041 TaxID=2603216 RepID=UPI00292A3D3E|nr:class I SAM-dependent methyltransferase [Streptomyces sp. TRM49041]